MKKFFIFIIFTFLSFTILGCSGISTTTTASTNTETVDARINLINQEYNNLQTAFPSSFSSNITLPVIDNEDYNVSYYLEDSLLVNNTLTYLAQSFDENLTITVKINYSGLEKTFSFEITQLRDETLYNEELLNQEFTEIFLSLENIIPEVIVSDLTLPILNLPGVEIDYSVNKSYLFHNRLIFTFPENDEVLNLTINVFYNRETRTLILPIIMSSFSNLPKIPEIHITTDGAAPIVTKEEYVYGSLDLVTYDAFNNSSYLLDDTRMRIKLRGNSTLEMPKKPYKIKFDDDQYMLSDYDEKEWVLLANFADQALIRNALAYQMSNDLGMTFAPMVKFVDVYINNVYQGNYMLSDQIEVSSNRVNVEEKSPDIDTGYLIEYDMKIYDEGLEITEENFFLVGGIPFVIKSPDIEDDHYSHDQYIFIYNYFQSVYDTLQNKQDYSHLIDIDSFIDWFIVNEVMKNVDSGYSSVYFHKEKAGLLKMGPVWDFDLSSGNPGHLQDDLRGPEGWYTSRPDKNVFFYFLMQYESFQEALKLRWNEVYEDILLEMLNSIYPLVDSMARSRYLNFQTWDIIGKNDEWYTAPEILELVTYEEQVWFLLDYLTKRVEWLNTEINLLQQLN
jgi:hypothetical protein